LTVTIESLTKSIIKAGLFILITIILSGCATTHRHLGKGAEEGFASWYGSEYAGKPTASGEIFNPGEMTAAHRTLPFNSWAHVINLENGKEADVRITDRGPYIDGRVIDVSYEAARKLDMVRKGLVKVRVQPIDIKH